MNDLRIVSTPEDVTKLRDDVLLLFGVDIMINDSTFKSMYDILGEISKQWDAIADVNKIISQRR